MSTTLTFRDIVDLPEWRSISQSVAGANTATANTAGVAMCEDLRSRDYASPLVYFLNQSTTYSYNNKLDAWGFHQSAGALGTFTTGSTGVFVPSLGPKGLLTGTNTTTSVNLDTMWQGPAAATWTRSGTTITVTTSRNHNLATGQTLFLSVTSDATATGAIDGSPSLGSRSITVTTATQFTFTGLNAGALSGTLTIGMAAWKEALLSNRGDNLGYIIRVIGSSAGGSGKIEERRIIGNTAGPTPTIYLDKALSFTPQAGDAFEILSGSVLFLNTGTLTTGIFRRFDIATGTFCNLSTTNLIATVTTTHNQLISLDEQYVPCDRNPGEGFVVGSATYDITGDFTKGCLAATASSVNTITGQASNGDDFVVANQFRNYQIRIVEDTTNPTAVNQRRRITSHTAGPSAVYTLASNWTVTPSATCEFVIENDTDRIIGFMGGATTIYNYFVTNLANTTATQNTWDTTSWGARSTSIAQGGVTWYAFGVSPTLNKNAKNTVKSSTIISFRGSSSFYDILDISGAATGTWSNGLFAYNFGQGTYDAFTNMDYAYFSYNPYTQDGKYAYFFFGASTTTGSSTQRAWGRMNSNNGTIEKIAGPKLGVGTTTINASRQSWISMFQDGTTKIAFYNCPRPFVPGEFLQLMLAR